MFRIRPFIGTVLVLFTFILLHNAILTGAANVLTLFREDNSYEAMKSSYKKDIDNLTKTISEYEASLENLKLFDFNSHVLSKIAIRNLYDFYDYLYVDTNSKVSEGSAVVNEDGLVGIVESSNKKSAKVNLLTGNVKISVKIGDVYGILDSYDKKNKELIVHNIDNYKSVKVESDVYTSGLQKIDKNLYIGKVSRVEEKGIEKIVYVKSYVDFDNLNYLVVLSK